MKSAKYFFLCLLALGLLLSGTQTGYADTNAPCDNDDPPECDPCEEVCEEDSDGENRFHVFSGNVNRKVLDFKLSTQVGKFPLEFSRTHTSRSEWAVQTRTDFPFGRGGNWRHSYQWSILDDGMTNGCQKLEVISPDSRVNYYNKKGSNDLFMTYLPSTHSRVWPDGSTNFYLYHLNGTKYHITQSTDGTNKTFCMEGFWDAHSNWYGFTYATNGYLTRVEGPNTNHFFELEYRGLEGAVDPGWIRFTYTNVQADAVSIPATWNDWVADDTPMQTNSSGVWEADVELGEGFYEYKFLVTPQGGGDDIWLADPANPLMVGPDSNSLAVVSMERIISQIEAGDGRSVDYEYDWDWNDGQAMLVMRLIEAQYGSGENALYEYYPSSYDQNRSVQLRSADDPHVRSAGRAMLYTYHTNRPYSGQIHEELFLSNSQMVARLEYDPNDSSHHMVINGAGTTNEYYFATNAANLSERSDALGRIWKRAYFGGNGMLQSRVDPMGRTSVYTRTWHFGAILTVSNNCGCGADVVNTYTDETYPFYLSSKTDAEGNTITYQRDTQYRPTGISYPDGTSEIFDYNAWGQVTEQKKRDGSVWTNVYDARGRITSRLGPEGTVTGYGYDAYDRVSSETNAVGLVTTFEYNWEGKPVRKVYSDQTEEAWSYNRHGDVTQSVSRAGGISSYEYDGQGHLIRTTDPVGAVTEATYDYKGRKVLETASSALVVSNTYDAIGRRIRRTYSSDDTFESWTYVYDGVSIYTNRLGGGTTNAYDSDGELASVTDARGNTTLFTYDSLGRKISTENALSETTSLTYDPAGRVTSVTDCNGLKVTNTYNANGQLIYSIRAGGITNVYQYDSLGHQTNVVLNGSIVGSEAYDVIGRTVWRQNADGVLVSNAYDSVGWLYRVYMPDGTYTENVYSNSWLWKVIDRASRTNITERDAMGRSILLTDPANRTVQYAYDVSGNRTNLVDQAGNNTFWAYDAEGRITRKIYADASHWDYTYDAMGRLESRTDAKSQVTFWQYDLVGNLTNINYPTDTDVSFSYDVLNRKILMTDAVGSTVYAYESGCGLLKSEDGPFTNDTLYYSYTDTKQLAQVTSAFQQVQYSYDNLMRLESVVGPEGTNTYSHSGAGTVWRELELGNGTTVTRQYDDLLRLTNMVNGADAGVLSSFAITYDNADQRTQVIREDGTRYDYGYDAIGQLTNAAATLADETPWQAYQFGYQFDTTGNPVEQDKNGLVYSNSFNDLNQNVDSVLDGALTVLGLVNYANGTVTVNSVQAQITSNLVFAAAGVPFISGTNMLNIVFTGPYGRSTNSQTSVIAAEKAYHYDANGNLTNDGCMAYFWSDENRLVGVRDAITGGLIQENRYDGLGRRREKVEYIVSGVITNRYLYQDWLVLGVIDGAGNVLETYTQGADLSGRIGGDAGGIGSILAATLSGEAVYFHFDFNGSIVQVSGSDHAQLVKYTYDPFGELLLKEGAFDSRYQFSTKEYDDLNRMNYYGYRYYSSQMGRWINRDPIEERGGINLFEYLNNDTINHIDYLGLLTIGTKWVCTGKVIRSCTSDPAKDCNECPGSESFNVTGEGKDEKAARADARSKAAAQATDCGDGCKADIIDGTACVGVPVVP